MNENKFLCEVDRKIIGCLKIDTPVMVVHHGCYATDDRKEKAGASLGGDNFFKRMEETNKTNELVQLVVLT